MSTTIIGPRIFKVWWYKTEGGAVKKFAVSDARTPEEAATWPAAAEFHVSPRYDEMVQHARAVQYRDYLNRLQTATAVTEKLNDPGIG